MKRLLILTTMVVGCATTKDPFAVDYKPPSDIGNVTGRTITFAPDDKVDNVHIEDFCTHKADMRHLGPKASDRLYKRLMEFTRKHGKEFTTIVEDEYKKDRKEKGTK